MISDDGDTESEDANARADTPVVLIPSPRMEGATGDGRQEEGTYGGYETEG